MTRLSIIGVTVAAIVAAPLGNLGVASVAAAGSAPGTDPVVQRSATAPDTPFGPAQRADAMVVAQARAAAVADRLGLGPRERLHVTDVERDDDGALHVRYSRTLGGLPVIGGDLIVHQASDGRAPTADFATRHRLTVATGVPTRIDARQASATARQGLGSRPRVSSAQQVVWAVDGKPRLAWLVEVTPRRQGTAAPQAVVVDAFTGRRIQAWDLHQEVRGTGRSLYSGRVQVQTVEKRGAFRLRDATRGGSVTVDVHDSEDPAGGFNSGDIFTDADNTWGNSKPGNRQTAAVDAAYGAAETWDYYLNAFDRTGIANNGKGAKTRVHYGENFDNAFWDDGCFCMTYGDGGEAFKPLVSVDIAGHEMTHGVTSETAGLHYFGDAGGLNESTSDIFGTMVEFAAGTSANPGNYRIGELVAKPAFGPYLRRMDRPSADGSSYDCWSIDIGADDPHFTSGPGNHFFYLLAEGSGAKSIGGYPHNSPTCGTAAAVDGIGRGKAAKIWYRALTRYFLSTSSYPDARDATIRSAVDLYGERSRECRQVVKSWDAVSVPAQLRSCVGRL